MNNYPNGPYPPQQGPHTQYPPQGYPPPPQTGYPGQPPMPGYPPPGYQPQQPMQPPKKRMNGWAIAGIIIGALVLCGGFSSFVKGFNEGMSGKSSTSSSSNTTDDIGKSEPAATPTPTPVRAWQTTHTYTGNGDKKTETFTVGPDWKIQWSCTPGSVSIDYDLYVTVYNSDSTMADWNAISTECKTGNASGESQEHKAGEVYLSVLSIGDWAITIQELK